MASTPPIAKTNGSSAPKGAGEPAATVALSEAPAESNDGSWDVAGHGSSADDPLLASLATITNLLECPRSADALTAGLPVPEGGLTPAFFIRIAERAGLSARLVKRRLKQITGLTLPCVLLLRDGNACILVDIDDGHTAQIIMPEAGTNIRRLAIGELAKLYIGYALFVQHHSKLPSHGPGGATVTPRGWFWGTLMKFWPIYGEVVLAAFLINSFALATPLFIMNVYDRVVPNNAIETLWVLALGVIIVFLFDFVLRTLRSHFADVAGQGADTLMASRMFEQVMGMRMAHRPRSAGAMASQLREFDSLRDFFTSVTLTTVVDLPFVFLFIAVIWWVGGPLALVPLVAVPLVILVGVLIQFPLNRVVRRTLGETAQKQGILVETLSGLETVKSLGAEGRLQRFWEDWTGRASKSAGRSRTLSSMAVNFAALSTNAVMVGVVVYGVYRISEGELTVGGLVACTILAGRAMAPLAQVAGLLTRFQQSRAALKSLNEVMQTPVERPADRVFLHRPHLKGEIEFKNITFTYPEQKTPVLNGLSFRIGAGERIGFIGQIGSGKSTIERLIMGLYEPDSGSVLVDGTDVRQIDPADLRRNIGCVPQETFLFSGTVRDNIAFSAPEADDAAVLRAARISGVEDFVRLHPLGFDLPVGERGAAISGGQRQAIAVARALLIDRPILIFDEPTSSMDNGSENRFKERLMATIEGKTLVLITHRASLLTMVNRLIVIDGGKVVADGPKETVLKRLAEKRIRTAGT
ncbi:MAG: type I secretion system permease/ATPase [Alphaproteobacteria bacterium]